MKEKIQVVLEIEADYDRFNIPMTRDEIAKILAEKVSSAGECELGIKSKFVKVCASI